MFSNCVLVLAYPSLGIMCTNSVTLQSPTLFSCLGMVCTVLSNCNLLLLLPIYIPWPFPPVWGVADNTKETTKTTRIQQSLDGTAGATQPILPRLPQLMSLHRCRLPYCPYHRAASTRQPRGNNRCQSEPCHNHSPLIPIPSTLTCLPYIHPPIIQGSLYSIHPPKPRPPSSISPVNFCIHYLFQ